MKHLKADLSKIKVVNCLYHRCYHTNPYHTLLATVDGVKETYKIRHRASSNDKLYYARGLQAVLIMYDDFVLAYEIIKFDSPASNINVDQFIAKYGNEDWYFDGEIFYQLNSTPNSSFLSIQEVTIMDPIHLTYSSTAEKTSSGVFVITKDDDIILQTTPISGTLSDKKDKYSLIDTEQKTRYLSLSMLLKMCDTTTKLYGAEEIEKFDLPQYMIRHKTVNLAKQPIYVKDNSSTTVTPVEAISYISGLMYKEDKFDNIRKLSMVLKSLVRGGVISVENSLHENIYTGVPIELKKVDLK